MRKSGKHSERSIYRRSSTEVDNTEKKTGRINVDIPVTEKLVLRGAAIPENTVKKAVAELIIEIILVAVIAVIVVAMIISPAIYKHSISDDVAGNDWYGMIIYVLLIIGLGILIRKFPRTISKFPARKSKEQKKEDEIARRKNYLNQLIADVDDYEKEIFYAMARRYPPLDDLFVYLDRNADNDWKMEINSFRDEEDFLTVRLGLGKLDLSEYIDVQEPVGKTEKIEELLWLAREVKDKCSVMKNIPKTVNLCRNGFVGVLGDGDIQKAYDIARVIIGQIGLNEDLDKVELAFAYDENLGQREWAEYKEIYQSDLDEVNSCDEKFFASNAGDAWNMLDRLADRLKKREMTANRKMENKDMDDDRHIVLFVGNPELLAGHRINKYISPDAGKYGFSVVVLADEEDKLPGRICCEIVSRNGFAGIHIPKTGDWVDVEFDVVTTDMLDRLNHLL